MTEETGKKRVHELARDVNISSEALIKVMAGLNIDVKSHMSTLTPEQVFTVMERFEKEKQEARTRGARAKKKKKKARRKKKNQSSTEAIKTVKDTLAKIDSKVARVRKKRRKKYREEKQERHEKQEIERGKESGILSIIEYTSLSELAKMMKVDLNQLIAKCLSNSIMVTANQRLDADTLILLGEEFNYEIKIMTEYGAEKLEKRRETASSKEIVKPPVVTIMGHVDHGKTALLDYIRSSNIIGSESGGITQHIGAYTVNEGEENKSITFIDTPGHAAFTSMRTRGAQVTDIVVLVIAADSKVMPQTLEAIDHAKAAGVPIIVAISKIDLSTANIEFVKQDLAQQNVLVEEWGGDILCAKISSITGEGIDDLLEKIILQAEVLELKAYPEKPAKGTVLDGRIDPRRGSVANLLIQDGVLHINDYFVAGSLSGRIRAMYDEYENDVIEVTPGHPVQILGCSGVPEAGDSFNVVEDEREAREISLKRHIVGREKELQSRRKVTLEEFWISGETEKVRTLKLIIKADVQGSVEVVSDLLQKLNTDEVAVDIIHSAAGGISENDVMLASASDAVIIGFNTRPDVRARESANTLNVEIQTFKIIYEVEETIRKALSGLLKPEEKEEFLGSAEVRQIFRIPKIGSIAGCFVVSGVIKRPASARLVRNGVIIWEGNYSSLKHFQEDRKEISAGFECGISLDGYADYKVNDIIECFEIIQISRNL